MSIDKIKNKIIPILKREGVLRAAVFGSAARGDMTKNSDVDILVKLKKKKTMLDFVSLKMDLEEKLNRDVDLVSYGGIHPLLKDIILKDQKVIYESRKGS